MIDTSADLSTESDKFYSHNYDLEKFRQANIIGECPQWRTNVTALLHQFFVDEIQPVRFGEIFSSQI